MCVHEHLINQLSEPLESTVRSGRVLSRIYKVIQSRATVNNETLSNMVSVNALPLINVTVRFVVIADF